MSEADRSVLHPSSTNVTRDPVVITLGPEDSALVIRADGSEEVITPKTADDAIVCDSAWIILQAVMAIHDREVVEFITDRMEASRG